MSEPVLTLGLPEIDPAEPEAIQAKQAMMLARERGLLINRGPFDMADPGRVATIRAELGPDAAIPGDDRVYAWAYLTSAAAGQHHVLIPEQDVVQFVVGYQALRIAQDMGLIEHIRHVWAADRPSMAAVRQLAGDKVELPTSGRYHLLRLAGMQRLVLVPEAHACPFVLGLAAGRSRDDDTDIGRLSYQPGILLT